MMRRGKRVVFGTTIDYQLRYHEGLGARLVGQNWEVHIVSSSGPLGAQLAKREGVIVHSLEMAREPAPGRDVLALLKWWKLLLTLRPSVVVLGTPKASLLGLVGAFLTRVPSRIYEVHGLRLESAQGFGAKLLWLIERIACRLATDIVPVSRSLERELLQRGIATASKMRVLGDGSPNGVDVDCFSKARKDAKQKEATRDKYSIDPSVPVMLFVGRLNEDKGLASLAQAVRKLRVEIRIQLLVAGLIDDDSGREGMGLLHKSGFEIIETGHVEDVAPLYAVADIFCLPSKREGLPTVILEAFAAEVPVVASDATGIVDLVEDGKTGRLVRVGDGDALASAVLETIRDRAIGRRMSRTAFELVSAKYTRDQVQRGWVEYLERGLGD